MGVISIGSRDDTETDWVCDGFTMVDKDDNSGNADSDSGSRAFDGLARGHHNVAGKVDDKNADAPGDSFGQDVAAHAEYINLYRKFDDAEAMAEKTHIHNNTQHERSGKKQHELEIKLDSGKTLKEGSVSWQGYFESINQILIEPLTLERKGGRY